MNGSNSKYSSHYSKDLGTDEVQRYIKFETGVDREAVLIACNMVKNASWLLSSSDDGESMNVDQ